MYRSAGIEISKNILVVYAIPGHLQRTPLAQTDAMTVTLSFKDNFAPVMRHGELCARQSAPAEKFPEVCCLNSHFTGSMGYHYGLDPVR